MRILIIISAMALSGCGIVDREFAKLTGKATEVCMRGVLYYQFTSGTAVALDQDGRVLKCGE